MHPKVLSHFKKTDLRLYKIAKNIVNFKDLPNRHGDDYFVDLVDAIVSQQLSGKAATTIFGRFRELFKDGLITPAAVLKLKDEKMRMAGVSYQKIKYIGDLAEKVISGDIDLRSLDKLSDEEIAKQLTSVKGIGRWTVEMFLIFTLKRPDVFSHGDLGLNKAIRKIYLLDDYSVGNVEKIVSRWSPYKSTASRILWHSLDNR